MSSSTIDIKEIRKLVIKGFTWQYIPIQISILSESFTENIPSLKLITSLYNIFAFFSYLYGYGLLADAADKYAKYKGYKNYFYIYSILNLLGLSFLFLLKNKNEIDSVTQKPLEEFSFLNLLTGWFSISILLSLLLTLIALGIRGSENLLVYTQSDPSFSVVSNVFTSILYIWYFIGEFKRSNLNYKFILGSLKKIDFKLPIGLAIIKYLFAWSINLPILYGLSFVFPQYVEYVLNQEHATTIFGWAVYAVSALLYAPILEEFICRGLILQKIAVKNSINIALPISAIVFALMHFRFDLIPLSVAGILYGILYLKTKRLVYPILCHFFYNFIVVVREIYTHIFSSIDHDMKVTVIKYQQQFINDWKWCVLFFALSAPYLCYFIYKNYPHNYSSQKLPYYVNLQKSDN